MKILHTSDWHVGKVLKGRDRYDEHAAVLRSIGQQPACHVERLIAIEEHSSAPTARALVSRGSGARGCLSV